jgi:hypothetical protein
MKITTTWFFVISLTKDKKKMRKARIGVTRIMKRKKD